MKQILYLDDDPISHKIVYHAIGKEFQLVSCYTIHEATKMIESQPSIELILIDRILPDGDGINFCTYLKQNAQYESIPIIFLSALGAENDVIAAFFAGADDYVKKPFGLLELKARVYARLRKTSKKLNIAGIEINLDTHRVFVNINQKNQEIHLTRIEYKILVTLIQSLEQVFTREMLLNKMWGSNCNVTDRVIDSHISHLRKKISQSTLLIESLRGEGYRMSVLNSCSDTNAA